MAWETQCSGGEAPVHKNKRLVQGDSWTIRVRISDPPADIAVTGEIRTDFLPNGTSMIILPSAPSSAPVEDNIKEFLLSLTPVESVKLQVGTNYVYDIQAASAAQQYKRTLVRGKVLVEGQVTS